MLRLANKKLYLLLFVMISLPAIYIALSHTETAKLRAAYEEYNEARMRAKLTLDITELSQVATGEALEKSIASVEVRKDSSSEVLSSTEVTIRFFGFRLLEYEGDRALIEARIKVRGFEQDPNTGKRTYYGAGNWYTEQVEMVREADVWKVKQLEITEWEQW